MKNKIILVAGGSASGKGHLTNILTKKLNGECIVVKIDSFCMSRDDLTYEERCKLNYDLPTSYNEKELFYYLNKLKNGEEVDLPVYDFTRHIRSKEIEHLKPKKYIFVEGLFTLYYESILPLGDYKIFMDCSREMRFQRRLFRDMKERARSEESVTTQFNTQVEPMHQKYIENTKKNANLIIQNNKNKEIPNEYIQEILKNIKF